MTSLINKILKKRKTKPNLFGPYSYNSQTQNNNINKILSTPPKPTKTIHRRDPIIIAEEKLAQKRKKGFRTPKGYTPTLFNIRKITKYNNPGINTIYCGFTKRGRSNRQIRKITSDQPITNTKIQENGKLTEFGIDHIYYNSIQYQPGPSEKWHSFDPTELLYGNLDTEESSETYWDWNPNK